MFCRDDSYRWVDEATFEIIGVAHQTRASEVLAVLLTDEHYVDAYQTADQVADDVHGAATRSNNHQQYLASLAESGLTPDSDPMRTGYYQLWLKQNRPGPEHGPYVLSAISLDTFDQLNGQQARQVLIDWLNEDELQYPEPGEVEGDLDGILADLATAETVFHLHELGEDAEHATGWIVQPYLELIVIDLSDARQLRLIAAGTD